MLRVYEKIMSEQEADDFFEGKISSDTFKIESGINSRDLAYLSIQKDAEKYLGIAERFENIEIGAIAEKKHESIAKIFLSLAKSQETGSLDEILKEKGFFIPG